MCSCLTVFQPHLLLLFNKAPELPLYRTTYYPDLWYSSPPLHLCICCSCIGCLPHIICLYIILWNSLHRIEIISSLNIFSEAPRTRVFFVGRFFKLETWFLYCLSIVQVWSLSLNLSADKLQLSSESTLLFISWPQYYQTIWGKLKKLENHKCSTKWVSLGKLWKNDYYLGFSG